MWWAGPGHPVPPLGRGLVDGGGDAGRSHGNGAAVDSQARTLRVRVPGGDDEGRPHREGHERLAEGLSAGGPVAYSPPRGKTSTVMWREPLRTKTIGASFCRFGREAHPIGGRGL